MYQERKLKDPREVKGALSTGSIEHGYPGLFQKHCVRKSDYSRRALGQQGSSWVIVEEVLQNIVPGYCEKAEAHVGGQFCGMP